MTPVRVIHLVDDTTPGGVMRMLDHLLSFRQLQGRVQQSVRVVGKSALTLGPQNAEVIVSHLALRWRALPALTTLRSLNPGARILHVEHSYTRAFAAHNVPNMARFHTMLRASYALFDGIVAVSEGQAAWLRQRGLVREGALRVLRPQVDLSGFLRLPPPDPAGRVIGAIGRLEPQKGFDVLIDAFRLCPLPDARLLIFGEGSERTKLEGLAQGDTRISFMGHCSDPTAAYTRMNIVAMPSRWEAFGLVAQEAQAAGRLVLASDIDGLSEQSSDYVHLQNGFSAQAWSKRLQHLLSIRPATSRHQRYGPCGMEMSDWAQDWLQVFKVSTPESRENEPAFGKWHATTKIGPEATQGKLPLVVKYKKS